MPRRVSLALRAGAPARRRLPLRRQSSAQRRPERRVSAASFRSVLLSRFQATCTYTVTDYYCWDLNVWRLDDSHPIHGAPVPANTFGQLVSSLRGTVHGQ